MKHLSLLLTLSLTLMACDKLKKAEDAMDRVGEMSAKMDQMNKHVQESGEGIRMSKMGTCVNAINSDYAAEHLYPVPTGLIACAKIFVEAATADEVVQYALLVLKQIDQVRPLKTFGLDGQEQDYSIEQQNKILRDGYRDFQSIMAIAGEMPPATVMDMIAQQDPQGPYRPTMLKLLLLRALFIRQILVENLFLETGKFETLGQAQKAIEHMKDVEFILRLPFADELQIKTVGLNGPEGYNGPIANADLKMDADTKDFLVSGWASIADIAENNLELSPRSARTPELISQQQQIVNEARGYANHWKEAQP